MGEVVDLSSKRSAQTNTQIDKRMVKNKTPSLPVTYLTCLCNNNTFYVTDKGPLCVRCGRLFTPAGVTKT